jgi:filamentous hemagglutinin family protein
MKIWHLEGCGQGIAIRLTARGAICLTAHFVNTASTLLFSIPAAAQIVPDATLPANSIVTPNGNTLTIEGGSRAGGNLFHSFKEFSLPTGSEAFFNNALDVQNIFSRVTGGNISNIDGLLRANGGANLFLLNPAGIVFGPNAQLNIGGSFFGTTANSIQFADGVEFSATNPSASPLLTVSVPVGLQMGTNPGEIEVNNTGHQLKGSVASSLTTQAPNPVGLQVAPGQTLALVGGNLTLDGGVLTASGGRVELWAIGQPTTSSQVGLETINGRWQLTANTAQPTGNLQFLHRALVNASGTEPGAAQMRGGNLTMQDGSVVWLENRGEQAFGEVGLHIANAIDLIGAAPNTQLASGIYADAKSTGRSSDIWVETQQLTLQEGGNISSRTFAAGDSGEVRVNADRVNFFDSLPDGIVGVIGTRTLGSGNANDVIIETRYFQINGGGSISSSIGTSGSSGNGGNILINASESIALSVFPSNRNDAIIGASAVSPSGNAGSITLNTARLSLEGGALISSSTFGSGQSGTITINAAESVTLSGSRFSPSRLLWEGSTIRTAGVLLPASLRTQANLPNEVTGSAGNIIITTPKLEVTDGAEVAVRQDSSGRGGMLEINADAIVLDRNGRLTGNTASGEGGDISVQTDLLTLRHGSNIATSAGGVGNGGNITIDSPTIVGLENSDIVANAVQGAGGNIQINTQGIFGLQNRPQLTPGNDITASSQFGLSGNVTITNPEVETRSFLVELPQNLVDTSQQITTGCDPTKGNTFTIAGRGGLPEDPSQGLLGRAIWFDDRDLSADGNTAALPSRTLAQAQPTQTIQEATGWVVNAQGQVELVANSPNGSSSWQSPASCQTLPLSSHLRSRRIPSSVSHTNVF